MWITELKTTAEGMNLVGFSLTRNRIPRLAELFDKAIIQQVTVQRIRNQDVYRFEMAISLTDEMPELVKKFLQQAEQKRVSALKDTSATSQSFVASERVAFHPVKH
jgi:hypothetical protein